MNNMFRIVILAGMFSGLTLFGCQQEPEEIAEPPAEEITGEEENLAEGIGEELTEAPDQGLVDTPPEKQLSEKLGDAAQNLEERVDEEVEKSKKEHAE